MTTNKAILATMAYADVFDYPLTGKEIVQWRIGKSGKWKVESGKWKKISKIKNKEAYCFFSGRSAIVGLRKQRMLWAVEKMNVAQRAATLLKIIPTIKLVGITGALAMDNSHKDDDIDFYIVTEAKMLWTTRFLTTVLLELVGLRRKPGDTSFRNKICLNMYVSEDHLAVSLKERDLFAAHEVLQMKPLWQTEKMYTKFLSANSWVKKFLPTAWEEIFQISNFKFQIFRPSKILFAICHLPFIIAESPLRWLQRWYMKKRKTLEVVSPTLIRFHPHDARVWVKAKLAVRLRRLNIPLDKIFYGR